MEIEYPSYPLFIVECTGYQYPVYWVPSEFADIEFLGTVSPSNIDLSNLLELYVDDNLNLFVGGTLKGRVLVGGVQITKIIQKGDWYWHRIFMPQRRKTLSAVARDAFKALELHRTSVGVGALAEFQKRRNF